MKSSLNVDSFPKSVIYGEGREVSVVAERKGNNVAITLGDELFGPPPFKLPFCSAMVCPDGSIFVSGTIGLRKSAASGKPELAGDLEGQTSAAMQIIDAVLRACNADADDIVKVNIYMTENTKKRFAQMNKAYLAFWGNRVLPARITTGTTALALGASVEIDCIAKASIG